MCAVEWAAQVFYLVPIHTHALLLLQGVRLLHESVAAPVQQLSAVLPQLLQLLAAGAALHQQEQQQHRHHHGHQGLHAVGSVASGSMLLPLPLLPGPPSSALFADEALSPAWRAAAAAASSPPPGLHQQPQQPHLHEQLQQHQLPPEAHLEEAYNLAAEAGGLVAHLKQALAAVMVAGEEERERQVQQVQQQQQEQGVGLLASR